MPVHFFAPPGRVGDLPDALATFVDDLEATGERVVGTQQYGSLTAIFTTKPPAPRTVTR